MTYSRRKAFGLRAPLAGAVLMACSMAACTAQHAPEAGETALSLDASPRALLANPGLDGVPMRGTFFFPGQWIASLNGQPVVGYYGRHFDSHGNAHAYTLHPADARHLGYSESAANRVFAVDQMQQAGVNTIVMSYWGPPGTDNWEYWAPMQDAPQAQEELFDAVAGRNVVIMPSIEDSDATRCAGGSSPDFRFASNFPYGLDAPNNQLVTWVEDIVRRFILRADKPEWASHFARMYDANGLPRYMIQLKDVSSTQANAAAGFANGFKALADRVHRDLGVDVGFTIDPLEHHDPGRTDEICQPRLPTTYIPDPANSGTLLQQPSLVAIQPYRSEITQSGGGNDRYAQMIAHKRDFIARWTNAGFPIIADVSSGYDGHIIFPRAIYVYGQSDEWKNDQSQLRSGKIKGLMFTAWNGYTEGWAGMPTLESGRDGTGPSAMNTWIREMFAPDPRDCNHVHFVGGVPTFYVYGAICEKYYSLGGTRNGSLGAPSSSEYAPPCAGARQTNFVDGTITFGAPGAHEVHGLIGQLYRTMNETECSWLGLPITDEKDSSAWCEGGKYNQFEHGFIDWCPGRATACAHHGDGVCTDGTRLP